ncbi:MAG: hypothetical protein HC898_08290 [Phycisphaerales bacterium]|nr:hypothetical protein [Phycisphaerales bacterium]
MDQPPALAQNPVREEATLDRELDLDTPPRLALAGSSPSASRPDRAAGEARESNAKLAGGSTITGSLSSHDDSNLAGDKRLPELAATPTEADPLFLKPSAPAPTREFGDLHQPVDSAKSDTAAAMATAPAAPSSPVIPSSTPAPVAALSEAGRVLPETESAGNQIASAAGQDQWRNVGAARGLVNNQSQLQRVQVVTPDPRAAQAELQLWASLNSVTMNALPDSALQRTNADELKSGPQTPREEQLYSQYRTPAQADVQLSRKLEQQTTNRQTFMVHLSLPLQQLQPMLVHLNQGRVGQNARLLDESSQLADSPEGSSRLRKQVELPTTMDQSPQDQFQRDQPKPPANEQEAIQVLIEFVEPEAQSP